MCGSGDRHNARLYYIPNKVLPLQLLTGTITVYALYEAPPWRLRMTRLFYAVAGNRTPIATLAMSRLAVGLRLLYEFAQKTFDWGYEKIPIREF